MCCASMSTGLVFATLVMLFCLIWWINYKFEEILNEVKNKK